MAHKAKWATQPWRMTDAVKKGEFVIRDTANAGQLKKQTSALQPVYAVAYSDLAAGDLFAGHHVGEQSGVVEVLAGADISRGQEIVCSTEGRGRAWADSTDGEGYTLGFTFRTVQEGEIFEMAVQPRHEKD